MKRELNIMVWWPTLLYYISEIPVLNLSLLRFQGEIFWVVMPCSAVVVYQCFRGPCCLHFTLKKEAAWTSNAGILPLIHGITTQKTLMWDITMKSSNFTLLRFFKFIYSFHGCGMIFPLSVPTYPQVIPSSLVCQNLFLAADTLWLMPKWKWLSLIVSNGNQRSVQHSSGLDINVRSMCVGREIARFHPFDYWYVFFVLYLSLVGDKAWNCLYI